MTAGQCHHQRLFQQFTDNKLRIDQRRSDESSVDPLIAKLFEEFTAEPLFQSQEDLREGVPECANNTWHKWMKWTCRRNPDADSALFTACRTPRRFECVVELCKHCPGIIEKRTPRFGQLDTTSLAAE